MATETRKIRVTNVQQYYGGPVVDIDVLVTIDWWQIAATMGAKAAFSAGKKSRSHRGAIKVQTTQVKS